MEDWEVCGRLGHNPFVVSHLRRRRPGNYHLSLAVHAVPLPALHPTTWIHFTSPSVEERILELQLRKKSIVQDALNRTDEERKTERMSDLKLLFGM